MTIVSHDTISHTSGRRETNPLPAPVSLLEVGQVSPAFPTADSPRDGWSGTTFVCNGKKFVVAISPEISKNGLPELRTYLYTGADTHVPERKLTTIVTEPLKPLAVSKYTGGNFLTVKTDGKKCAFCQKLITWGNRKTKYCSEACRTAGYRQRKERVTA